MYFMNFIYCFFFKFILFRILCWYWWSIFLKLDRCRGCCCWFLGWCWIYLFCWKLVSYNYLEKCCIYLFMLFFWVVYVWSCSWWIMFLGEDSLCWLVRSLSCCSCYCCCSLLYFLNVDSGFLYYLEFICWFGSYR